MSFLAEWTCRFSPAVGAAALVVLAIAILVLWRGGTIETLKVVGIFDVKLSRPFVLRGSRWLLVLAVVAFGFAAALSVFQMTYVCERCESIPGGTAWIWGGEFNAKNGDFIQGPFVQADTADAGTSAQDIAVGHWLSLTQQRSTIIPDFSKTGTEKALESPFTKGVSLDTTCRVFSAGQRLYVADKRTNGPKQTDQHVWYRIRVMPPGSGE